jgi:hypothetical protein
MPGIVGIVPLWRNRGEDLQNTFPSLLVSSLARVKTRVRGRYHGTKPLWNTGQGPSLRCSGDSVGIWPNQPGPGIGLRLYRSGQDTEVARMTGIVGQRSRSESVTRAGTGREPVPVAEGRSGSGVAQASRIGIARRNTEDRIGERQGRKRAR